MRLFCCCFALLLLFGVAPDAISQSSAASLHGSVIDARGAAIASAEVLLLNQATGFSSSTLTDTQGEYHFHQVPTGLCLISVIAHGFALQSKTSELMIGQSTVVNFHLSVQSLHTAIEVNSTAGGLNQTDASMGDSVNSKTLQTLPIEGRNIPDLLSLQPGVLYLGSNNDQTHDSRSGSSVGARSDQGNLTLDGVDNNDQARSYAFAGVLRSTLDSVQEFRVTTIAFGADAGRSSGEQVTLLTKSGTNQTHGTLYEYNRSSLGEANDWFNKQAELSHGLPNRPGKLIRNTFGVSLGGPFQRNRLFYFVNYEGQRTAENRQQTLTVPTASMRAGNLQYLTQNTGQTYELTPANIAAMDPLCAANHTCPWGPGVDPNVLAVLNQYPLPNTLSSGDGLNTAGYTWSAPNPASLNTYIARFDFMLFRRNWFFVRANLQNDKLFSVPQFPGQTPSTVNTDNSKGFALGDTWSLTSNSVNNLHYGFIGQSYASRGVGQGTYANLYNISPLSSQTRTMIVDVNVHNIIDDMTVTRGSHTFQFGANERLINNHHRSDSLSYSYGYTNSFALNQAGIANTGQSFDPAAFGFPAVSNCVSGSSTQSQSPCNDFSNSYNIAAANLAGLLDLVTTQANYRIAEDGKSASLLPSGAMLDRNFRSNEFEYYFQDSWRVRPRLTITFGLRHSILQTPYESHGQQVQPTIDMDQWFRTRREQAALGSSVQPDISFAPSGQARGLKPYWPIQWANVAPRVAIAFSPAPPQAWLRKIFGSPDDSSFRASYGIYYDHYGQGIVNQIDSSGSFGLTNSISNPTNLLTPDNSPRFTGVHDLPNITGIPASLITYPMLSPNDPLWTGFEIAHGLDDHMKTPFSHVVNLSIQRQIHRDFLFEVAYIGRFGRHQLQQIDLAQPLNLVDKRSGQDYFTAATQLSKLKYSGAVTVPESAYFEDMFPDAAGGGNSATQNIYSQVWFPGNETGSLYMIDILCSPGCGGSTNRFWPRQFASLYAWSSIGRSNYNAGQIILSHKSIHGIQLEMSYTFSKSLDMGSDAERTLFSSSTGTSQGSSFGAILNAWNPRSSYAPSDFDVRHLVAGNWIVELPIGKGRYLLGNANRAVNKTFGGWQFSGIGRWTSGLPFSIISGTGWGTNWSEKSNMIQTGSIRTHTHIENGVAQAFADPTKVLANLRNPYPGEAGQRNNFRGDGYFGVDASLSKNWIISERSNVRFAWEVFNVSNSVRFDVNPLNSLQNMTTSGALGVYSSTTTRPRVQQFSLRLSF